MAPPPQPLPLPPPPLSLPSPPAAPRRGRHRASTSSSSSSSSSFHSCPSPSPSASPPRASSASLLVPFSWERHAGVPKMNSFRGGSPTGGAPLPLPPPLRPAPRRRRRRRANANAAAASSSGPGTNSGDPFAAAFAECTREDGEDDEADHVVVADSKLWLARTTKPPQASGRGERRWWLAAGVGFLDLYGCKSAMAVADGAFLARRASRR